MSDKPSFFFDQFVPGFDFLKNLASGAGAANGAAAAGAKGSLPGIPGIPSIPGVSNWIAPTLSVEEVDKRIQELKAVQFWLDQNLHALKATIQALEVQRMTLSTLQGMNLQMEDLAKAFTGGAGLGAKADVAPKAAAAREKAAPKHEDESSAPQGEAAKKPAAPAVDPMQLWGALTQQFQQIATTALQDAAQLKMPAMFEPKKEHAAAGSKPAASAPPAKKTAARKRTTAARRR